jgi:tetratricopeptide (TPR) repeat protein
LAIRNEDFFALSNHVRLYEHDDLHEAVAHDQGSPLYKRCKRDLSKARIDVDLFEQLPMSDRLRMVQEEFMVIGLERFWLHDRSLGLDAVYSKGMHKTIRDLFVGYFQDFCIDHIDQLLQRPAHDFIERFECALREGRVRDVEIAIPPLGDEHKKAWALIRQGQLVEARRICEDLVRRGDFGGDPHAFFLLGLVMLRSRNLGVAEKCFRKCLSRDRKNALAWFHLGTVCRMLKKNTDAIKFLHNARELGVRNYGLFMNLGLAYESEDKPREALQAYRRALDFKGDDPRAQARLRALGTHVH